MLFNYLTANESSKIALIIEYEDNLIHKAVRPVISLSGESNAGTISRPCVLIISPAKMRNPNVQDLSK